MQDLRSVLNRHSAENQSDTPDFILAQYMLDALAAFEKASRAREDWYGHRHAPDAPAVSCGCHPSDVTA